MDHRYCDHAGELPGGQLETACAGQLDSQDAKEEGGKLLAQAGPDAAAKGQVVEASLFVFSPFLTEAVRVEGVYVLEDGCSVVGVSNAVHYTPAFWNLDSLNTERQRNEANEQGAIMAANRPETLEVHNRVATVFSRELSLGYSRQVQRSAWQFDRPLRQV